MNFYWQVLIIFTLSFHSVDAENLREKEIQVSNGNTSVIRPGQQTIAVYVNSIENKSREDVALVQAFSESAANIEFHSMQIVDNVMKMKRQQKITIPAKSTISLNKGNKNGYHLMLLDIAPETIKDNILTITLVFSNGENLQCKILVTRYSENKHKHHQK